MTRRLTAEAQAERDDFESEFGDRGCTCFVSPPCSHCTHPGHPLNQEDDECYEPHVPSTASRNKREGKYFGTFRRRARRMGSANFDTCNYLPFEVSHADFAATRKERRQHNLNRSSIRRQALGLCK